MAAVAAPAAKAGGRRGASRRQHGRTRWALALLLAIVALGIVLDLAGAFDTRAVLDALREWPAGWPLALALVALQVLLYAFAWPGSVLMWAAAVLYPVPVAAALLTAGGTVGALAAHRVAARLAGAGAPAIERHRVARLIAARGDFATLTALRLLPGVPHSLINVTAGALRVPLPGFVAATALGFAVKSSVYCSAIAALVGAATPADLLRPRVLVPLVGLAALLLAGRFLRERWLRRR